MFEKYNTDTQRILTYAESVAFSYNTQSITLLFLLYSFLKTPDSELYKVSEKHNIDIDKIEKEYFKYCEDNEISSSLYMEYSPELKKVLEDSENLMDRMKLTSVSPLCLAISLIENYSDKELRDLGYKDKKSILHDLKTYIKKSPELDKINDLHRLGEKTLDPLIGREDIIKQLTMVLSRRNKPNPLLIGEPGVGKSFIVSHLAKLIKEEKIPSLKDKTIFELDLPSVLGGTKYRGEFEEKIKKVLNKVIDDGHAILFIDEIHNIVKAGGADGAIDCSNIIKPYLSRNEIQIIGATTYDEYNKMFSMDKALKRRFQPIIVSENTSDETLDILKKLAPLYSAYYHKNIDENLLLTIVDYAKLHLPNLSFPDKAIDILDNSLAICSKSNLSEEDIANAMQNFFHVDVKKRFDIDGIIEDIKGKIIGQDDALDQLKKDLKLSFLRKDKDTRPKGIFFFVGPSGTGKSCTAKLLAQKLFSSENAFLKIDLAHYKDISSLSGLKGTTAGYVGYKDDSSLVKQLKKNPHSLILLDEVEKAYPAITDFFLSIFEEGYFESGSGEKIDCSNAIFVLTGNLSFDTLSDFHTRLSLNTKSREQIERKLSERFKYEFLARLDDVIIFKDLKIEDALKIESIYLSEYGKDFIELEPDQKYENEIHLYGARAAIKRAHERLLKLNLEKTEA